MIVSISKIIFLTATVIMVALTIGACTDREINWQIRYALIAMSLGCVGNITNWRRHISTKEKNENGNSVLDLSGLIGGQPFDRPKGK